VGTEIPLFCDRFACILDFVYLSFRPKRSTGKAMLAKNWTQSSLILAKSAVAGTGPSATRSADVLQVVALSSAVVAERAGATFSPEPEPPGAVLEGEGEATFSPEPEPPGAVLEEEGEATFSPEPEPPGAVLEEEEPRAAVRPRAE